MIPVILYIFQVSCNKQNLSEKKQKCTFIEWTKKQEPRMAFMENKSLPELSLYWHLPYADTENLLL